METPIKSHPLQEPDRFRNVLLYLIFLGLSLRFVFFLAEMGLEHWADHAALYSRNDQAEFEKWYSIVDWQFSLKFFFEQYQFLFNSLYYLAFCYVVRVLVLPAFKPTAALLAAYPLSLFRLAVGVYLVFPACEMAYSFWGGLGYYTDLWWAILFFVLCLAYLLLEGLALWIRDRWRLPSRIGG